MDNRPLLLEMRNITKTFPGVRALTDVSLGLRHGEVLALLGENGAGKSTLMKVLAGAYPADSGEIYIDGQAVTISKPSDAQAAGIAIVYQDLKLANPLSIAENIFMGRLPGSAGGVVNWGKLWADTKVVLDELGVRLDPKVRVGTLSVAGKQLVEIAKALSLNARILVLDEPSAVLTPGELEHLFEIIRGLEKRGVSCIYISHRLEEIFVIADRATVLKDGQVVGTVNVTDVDRRQLIKMMVGRELGYDYPPRTTPIGDVVMEVRNLSRRGVLHDISFTLRKGEILGIAGLVGAGRSELARAVFGADPIDSGQVIINGKEVKIGSPAQAVHHRLGFVTEDRHSTGLFPELSVAKNITMAALPRVATSGVLNLRQEAAKVLDYIKRLNIATPSPDQKARNLSGGNQQRVVLAKWIDTDSRIFILDEPTRGIDVGSKAALYKLMRELLEGGASIIMISSELPEIIGMSDRVLVMNRGTITGELSREELSEEEIMQYAVMEVPA